jgi:hypothetical protein
LGADGRIYLLGGATAEDGPPTNDVWIFDTLKDSWVKGPPMNVRRDSLAAVATHDGKIYAIGGTDVGAHKNRAAINWLLPKGHKLYTGHVQETVEVLDIKELKK